MKSNIEIKVEFLAGTDISEAVTEAKQKANLWQVSFVSFNFNGTDFSISPSADVEKVIKEYRSTNGKPYGICE